MNLLYYQNQQTDVSQLLNEDERRKIKIIRNSFRKLEEYILYGLQLVNSVDKGMINPNHFDQNKRFFDKIPPNWSRDIPSFKEMANFASIAIFAQGIIIC